MSLSNPAALGCFAMAQGVMVLPPLGESYAGKSGAAIAGLLVMLADGEDQRMARRIDLRTEMAGILPETAPLPGEGWYTGLDRLMGLVSAALEKAEATDPLLAARLLDWLIEWTANERLVIPPPPPTDPAQPPA